MIAPISNEYGNNAQDTPCVTRRPPFLTDPIQLQRPTPKTTPKTDNANHTFPPSCSPKRSRSSPASTRPMSPTYFTPHDVKCREATVPAPHPGILVAGVQASKDPMSRRKRTRTPLGFARFVASFAKNYTWQVARSVWQSGGH